MSWFARKKSPDPLAARERELQAELARLQSEITRLSREPPAPVAPAPAPAKPEPPPAGNRPFAQPVRPPAPAPRPSSPAHFNELGGQKFDLQGVWRRLTDHLRGPTANNPRMAKMLAAGSIHGLRPLRYERRVARNRFIALFVILLLILWGIGYTYIRKR